MSNKHKLSLIVDCEALPQSSQTSERFFLERDYALGYLSFSMSSDEEDILGGGIYDCIKKHAENSNSLLELGPADGRIASKYCSIFSNWTMFEPNELLFSLFCSRFNINEDMKIINSTYDIANSNYEYDVVVASHMLYHIEEDARAITVGKWASQLRTNGIIISTLWSEKSQAYQLTQLINPDRWLCTAESMETKAISDNLKLYGLHIVDIIDINPVVKSYSRSMALEIARFLVGRNPGKTYKLQQRDIKNLIRSISIGITNETRIAVYKKI